MLRRTSLAPFSAWLRESAVRKTTLVSLQKQDKNGWEPSKVTASESNGNGNGKWPERIQWPGKADFAFTVFDDADSETLERGRAVYSFLYDLGMRTTKSVWPISASDEPSDDGETCDDAKYREWVLGLQRRGFEIGYHMATSHTSKREDTIRGIEQFAKYFGHYPLTMAQHFFCDENLYWGDARVTGSRRLIYNLATAFRNRSKFWGHVPGHPYFWGDICRQKGMYVRNFAFPEVDSLKACPFMPYHDPARPYVKYWFASSSGATVQSFNQLLNEKNQESLEESGGACIMYTHFGLGFYEDGGLNQRFRDLMTRLRKRNGWFVPVSTLLDYLKAFKGPHTITDRERAWLERRWLLHKLRTGTE